MTNEFNASRKAFQLTRDGHRQKVSYKALKYERLLQLSATRVALSFRASFFDGSIIFLFQRLVSLLGGLCATP